MNNIKNQFFPINNFLNKIFNLLSFLILLNPLISFTFFSIGFKLIYHKTNILLLVLLVAVVFTQLFLIKVNSLLKILPIIILLLFFFAFLNSFDTIFQKNDFVDLLGLYIGIISPLIIGIQFLIKDKIGDYEFKYKFIFKSSILIAVINIVYFFLLYFGNYELIFGYTEFIGLGGYIEDLGSLFIRPAGYFYDYHSQYFLPIISFYLVLFNKIKLKGIIRIIILTLFLLSIIISGVKSAYITVIFCFLYIWWSRNNNVSLFLIIFIYFLVLSIIDFFTGSFIYDLAYKILTHDIEIIILHLFEVPLYLVKDYILVFLFGGQVHFAGFIYSEVYLVTLIYYIGIIGLFLFFLLPFFYLYNKVKSYQIFTISLIIFLSLLHYYVFKTSVNVFGSALLYYFALKSFISNNKQIQL